MSMNIGNEGCQAARELQGSSQWAAIRKALAEVTRQKANAALDAAPEHQAGACGYARALRDISVAFESATSGVAQNQIKKPGVKE